MSFIAGYLMGLGEGDGTPTYIDPRIPKLTDNSVYPPMRVCSIADGWNIRIKAASDIDNARSYHFGTIHHNIQHYTEWWSLYYCVYYNDEFRYAVCNNPFLWKYEENYQNADVPNNLYSIRRISGILINSAEITFPSQAVNGPCVSIEGTYVDSKTYYSWTNEGTRIEGETETANSSFSKSCESFFGDTSSQNLIVNGGASDFENAVYGLYAACLKRI